MIFVVRHRAIAKHSHDIWKYRSRSLILVCVDEYAQTVEVVGVAKDLSWLRSLFRKPYRHPISMQVPVTMDFEFYFYHPIRCCHGHSRE